MRSQMPSDRLWFLEPSTKVAPGSETDGFDQGENKRKDCIRDGAACPIGAVAWDNTGGTSVAPAGVVEFVPEGLNDRSQAIYCLETDSIENPSRRERSDPYPRLLNRPDRSRPIMTQSYRALRYGSLFARIPGNKIAWLRSFSPSGTKTLNTCPRIRRQIRGRIRGQRLD